MDCWVKSGNDPIGWHQWLLVSYAFLCQRKIVVNGLHHLLDALPHIGVAVQQLELRARALGRAGIFRTHHEDDLVESDIDDLAVGPMQYDPSFRSPARRGTNSHVGSRIRIHPRRRKAE